MRCAWWLVLGFGPGRAEAQVRTVATVEIRQGGPATFGMPVPMPRPGERLSLRSGRRERRLQIAPLAPPAGGRQWLLLRSEGEAGRFELQWERTPEPAASPPASQPAATLPLRGLGEPGWLPAELGPWQRLERGLVACRERVVGIWGEVAVALEVVRWGSGRVDLQLRFTTPLPTLVTLQDLNLWLPCAAQDRVAPDLVTGAAGAVRWVLARERGQAGFVQVGERVQVPVLPRGTLLEAGEVLVVELRCAPPGAPPPAERPATVRVPPAFWRHAGLLPRGDGSRGAAARQDLATVAQAALSDRVPGREFGGFQRGKGVWTNLEFDTALALLRLEMAGGADALLWGAFDSARHWAGRLLAGDGTGGTALAGLPYLHGARARSGGSETGHVWVSGAMLVALRTGDGLVLDAARRAGDALARAVLAAAESERQGRRDRSRNLGWPLLELETLVRIEPRELWARAADAAAADLLGRFDRTLLSFRFGESESERSPTYEEKLWLTGGILLPALRAHLARRPEQRRARDTLRLAEAGLLGRAVRGDGRVRSHAWLDSQSGAVLGDGAPCEHARALFVLEGLPPDAVLPGALATALRRVLRQPVDPRSSDPMTQMTMAGRLDLVFR